MSSKGQQNGSSFPNIPASLSADVHPVEDHYEQKLPVRIAHSLDDLTPYLGLRARLSQVWLNKWTILILLVLARVLIAIGNLHDDIDTAQAKALSACTSVETMGSAVASLPHYMAEGTNELAAHGITKTVDGLEAILFLALTAIEQIFLFVINMMYGTYECLITFAVTGSSHVAIALIEDATTAINKSIADITSDLDNTVNTFQSDFQSFLNGLSSIGSLFGGKMQPPALSLTAPIAALGKIQIPGDINTQLNTVNNSIPSFDEIHNFTNQVLSIPFEEVRKLLNNTLGNYTFNQSVFSVPEKQSLDFCTSETNAGITDFFNGLYNVANIARTVFIVVLLLAALLACVPWAMLEIRRWRKMKERSRLISTGSHEPMDVIYIVSRPITATMGMSAAHRFASPKKQVLTRWFIAYITSTPALLVLAIALAGLFSCLCQFILLRSIEKEVPALAAEVGQFADKVIDALNQASETWANSTNAAIIAENSRINNDVFGWVNTTTSALNGTLDAFINETTFVIDKAFGGTLLEEPVKEVFNCLIGLKIAAVQRGLAWAQENAEITFPLFPNDVFSAGAAKSIAADNNSTGVNSNGDGILATPGSDATDAITGAVVDLTDKLAKGIQTETFIATGVLLCYVAVLLTGAFWTLLECCRRRSSLRGAGGRGYNPDDYTVPDSPRHQPRRQNPARQVVTESIALQPMAKEGVDTGSTGPVYDWSHKSAGLPSDNTMPHRQSQGVIDDHDDDPFKDEKSGYPPRGAF